MKPFVATLLITLGLLAADQGLLGEQRGRGRGNQTPTIRQLAWIDRSGDVQGTIGPRMSSILDPSISPTAPKWQSAADRTRANPTPSMCSKVRATAASRATKATSDT